MKNATDSLLELLEESEERLRSNASQTNPEVKSNLELRIMEIRNWLTVTLRYDAHPPLTKDMPDYMRASEKIADVIKRMKKDPLCTGDHVIYLKS